MRRQLSRSPAGMPSVFCWEQSTSAPDIELYGADQTCDRSISTPFCDWCADVIRGDKFGCCWMKHRVTLAPRSKALASALDITFVWLPKQCSELNAMDHLWREMKGSISANYQFASIDEHAAYAENWILNLSNRQALCKAGVMSKNFWLRSFLP